MQNLLTSLFQLSQFFYIIHFNALTFGNIVLDDNDIIIKSFLMIKVSTKIWKWPGAFYENLHNI